MKLNPIAKKWVDALRSGEYKQGRNHLRSNYDDGVIEYCCLGVLCEIAIQDGIALERTVRGYDFCNTFIPHTVMNWSGMKTDSGMLECARDDDGAFIKESLAVANDDGYTFEQIADMIEKYADVLGVEEKI